MSGARQIPLPLAAARTPGRIIVGSANAAVLDALGQSAHWPYRTALLAGPPRSGKSLLARWFATSTGGEVLDDVEQLDETDLFHRWNRAQEAGRPLLMVVNALPGGWTVRLPDLASRLGAALHLAIGTPDDAMLADLIALHAEQRSLALGPDATAYLVPRVERSHLGAERIVATIDRLSLARKQPPTLSIWREALEELNGPGRHDPA
ncbi:ATPase [Novosphingobium piscinae]|uniref:ATPase n=1 Tax=Novosphingobium piscinae TaxID=1507448 RepID=A0A7X1FYS2_9SPHN|nr:ATPase [Novosphingobium piscinae]MBC2668887.1 ATPase [Novosphingobium piscinae]